jgi:hypothetical protein
LLSDATIEISAVGRCLLSKSISLLSIDLSLATDAVVDAIDPLLLSTNLTLAAIID